MKTVRNLDNGALESLLDLIQINFDSATGFQDAAEKIDDNTLAILFSRLAREHFVQSQELKRYAGLNGETPEVSGNTARRFWMDLHTAINNGDPKSILIEAERSEDKIAEKYEMALKETAGSPLNGVLRRHYLTVKSGHDQVRDLCDSQLN